MLLCAVTTWAQISALTELSNDKAYLLKNANDMGYAIWNSGNNLTLCGASSNFTDALDATATNNNWQIVSYENNYYLYNLGAQKFAVTQRGATYLTEVPTPIKIESVSKGFAFNSTDDDYTYMCAAHHLNPPVQWWSASDNGSAWQIIDNTENITAELNGLATIENYFNSQANITVNHVCNDKTIFSEVVTMEKGTAIADTEITTISRLGLVYSSKTGTTETVENNTVITVTYTIDDSAIPFTVSTLESDGSFGAGMVWYHLTMRSKDVSYDAATGYALAQNVAEKNTSNLFAFTGNPIDGFNIYNYAAGAGKVFWRADATNGGRVSFTNIDETNGNTWILSKNGDAGYVFRLNGYTNGYMNDHQPEIAIWNYGAGATDAGSTITFTYVEDPDLVAFYDVTYNYVYNGDTKFTKTITVEDGANYPAHAYVAPYGVAIEGEIPAETVTGNTTKEFALTITKELPFEEGKYYYVRMHTNQPGFIGDIADDNTINVAWGKLGTSADTKDNYLWEFVGNVFDGIKVVNKGTGLEMTTNGGGNVTLTENGTSLFITETTAPGELNATDGFCLRNPNSANYINANYSAAKLAHWSATDAGSTFMLIEPTESLDVEITAAGYATYYWDLPAYIPEGVQAFVINELNGTYAIMNEITGTIPANTGVVLKGSADAYSFAVAHYVTEETTTAVSGNMLRGSVASTDITPAENTTYYVLANGDEGVGLYPDANENGIFRNNANKAYMPVVVEAEGNAAASYSFNFDWAGTTGVEGVVAEGAENGAIYDITGRCVKAITAPGLYIINGVKVVVK